MSIVDNVSVEREIHEIFDSYSRWGLYRKARRDALGHLILCPQCRKIGNQTKSLGHICDKCLGVGYIWDEEWIRYYQWPGVGVARSKASYKEMQSFGMVPTGLAVIYVEMPIRPIEEDKILEVRTDKEGTPLEPTQRNVMFDIRSVDDYKLDHGRYEYYRLTTLKQVVGYYGQTLEEFKPGERRVP